MNLTVIIVIVVIVVVAVVAFLVHRHMRMGRDPEYAAKIGRQQASKNLERQQRKMERAQQREQKSRYEEAIAPEKANLLKARKEYNSRVDKREAELRKATREHDKAVHDQERVIADIKKEHSRYIGSIASIKMFADHLAVRETTVKINPTIRCSMEDGVHVADNAWKYSEFTFKKGGEGERPSASGSLIGGIGKPETLLPVTTSVDFFYLFIYGTVPESDNAPINICIPLNNKNYDDGKGFMETLNSLSSNVVESDAEYNQKIADETAKLEEIKNDTAAIDSAQEALDREHDDHAAVDEAQQRYEEAKERAKAETGYSEKR